MKEKSALGLNSNQLKLIAIVAMTIDHVADIVSPYSTEGWVVLCHVIGRLTAPIMWFFYVYYPLHLFLLGLLRLLLYGNVNIAIGT